MLTYQGRLPGVACIATLPAGPQPIRLDVPAFVGFAQRGPLNQPTAVEDINQYQAVFGGDLVLAQSDGVPVYAHLPGTVKSFFDNGGVRCYVVRVAGPAAQAARWLVPGLRRWQPSGKIDEVFVEAAWPGAWSAGVEVGTQLLRQPLAVTGEYQPASTAGPGKLPVPAASALAVVPGDLIQLDLGPSWPGLYLTVAGLDTEGLDPGSLDPRTLAIRAGTEVPVSLSPAVDLAQTMSPPGPVPVVSATLLRFDVIVQLTPPGGGPGQQLEQWPNLTFNPPGNLPGPVYWLDVTQQAATPDLTRSMFLRADPLAAGGSGTFVPLEMDALGTSAEFVDAAAGSPPIPGVQAGDDGLSTFDPVTDPVTLFLDPHLLGESVYDLIDDANQYTVLSSDPIQLTGIHALIGVDEVAMISVPDAAHLGWTSTVPTQASPPPAAPAPARPPAGWSGFRSCAPPPPAPVVSGIVPASGPGTGATVVTISGSSLAGGTVTFGGTAATSVSSATDSCTATSPAGTGTVDVTVTTTAGTSAVSPADQFTYQATALPYPMQDDVARYDPSGLMSVQVALVQLCAARADAVAVLSLPAHYGPADFLAWSQRLTSDGRISGSPLSYAAVWHPWVQVTEPTTPQLAPLRPLPPDGAATGTIAARENARGVWVAPANIALRGVVDLTPALAETGRVSLFNAHGNLFVHHPGAFVGLSAHTLSPDPSLLQLSVRRLLILLRKIALQQGMTYVFATNTDRFRQMVRRSFERLLTALTQFGAIVNFQVVTDGGVNTADDIANGRLIVQLMVAPTNPVEFITVTLVRAGEGLLDVLEGSS